jgi:hypothetical protein
MTLQNYYFRLFQVIETFWISMKPGLHLSLHFSMTLVYQSRIWPLSISATFAYIPVKPQFHLTFIYIKVSKIYIKYWLISWLFSTIFQHFSDYFSDYFSTFFQTIFQLFTDYFSTFNILLQMTLIYFYKWLLIYFYKTINILLKLIFQVSQLI